MTNSLFRRLFFAALALVAVTLLAVNQTLTANAVDTHVRVQVLAISLAAAGLGLGVAFLVSRSLSMRVSRLKRLAEGLAGATSDQPPVSDSQDDLASLER